VYARVHVERFDDLGHALDQLAGRKRKVAEGARIVATIDSDYPFILSPVFPPINIIRCLMNHQVKV
jgi:hypothetical protein